MVMHSSCSYSLFVLALVTLSCQADQQIKLNSATVVRRASPSTIRPIRVDKIRDVEAVDPGLLSPPSAAKNSTATRSVTDTLGKQSNTGSNQGTLLGQETVFGNPVFKNAFGGANSFNQDNGFQQFSPGVGQPVGGFGQQGQVGGFGQPPIGTFNQPGIGGFPNNGAAFPGGGVLPGGSQLPPGSVAADSVAFSAARASDFTRVGVTQVRFDYTLTDIGYGWYPDRSEFVCYYPGLYFFTYHGLSTQTRQFKQVFVNPFNLSFEIVITTIHFFRLSLVKNNLEVVSAWGDTNGYQSGSNTAILALNQGDRVYLVLQEGKRMLNIRNPLGFFGKRFFSKVTRSVVFYRKFTRNEQWWARVHNIFWIQNSLATPLAQ
jgi:C1q domain